MHKAVSNLAKRFDSHFGWFVYLSSIVILSHEAKKNTGIFRSTWPLKGVIYTHCYCNICKDHTVAIITAVTYSRRQNNFYIVYL